MSEYVEQHDGCYYIPGTRISLDSIVYAFRQGVSPESLREDFDGLSLPHVYGASAYYLAHQAEVAAYLIRRPAQWRELEQQGTPFAPIDDGEVLNQLAIWASDAATRHKILVANPARLYGF